MAKKKKTTDLKTAAKKLADWLENDLGWTVYNGTKRECNKKTCSYYTHDDDQKFCAYCGLPLKEPAQDHVLEELEQALKFALGE